MVFPLHLTKNRFNMKSIIFYVACILCFSIAGCSSSKNNQSSAPKKITVKHEMLDDNTFKLTEISDDETYGYSEKNAVCVADASGSGPLKERNYLNALLGPKGEPVSYFRKGSCCTIKSDYGFMGMAKLDIYEVSYEGLDKPIILYINMYDPGQLKAPKGFTFKQ